MNVNGTMRRLQPVCAQALPWSTSFIGCPGIKCDDGHDFTELFLEDGSRNAGNRRTTPLEVEHPKDVAAFHARSTNCPWAKPNLQVTLERLPIHGAPRVAQRYRPQETPQGEARGRSVRGLLRGARGVGGEAPGEAQPKVEGWRGGGRGCVNFTDDEKDTMRHEIGHCRCAREDARRLATPWTDVMGIQFTLL